MIRRIFLDMDGVIANFSDKAISAVSGCSLEEAAKISDRLVEHDFHGVLGITEDDFWRSIDAMGDQFWAELPPYPWMNELVATIDKFAPWTILSAPSMHPSCAAGKMKWIYKHFGSNFRNFALAPRKWQFARSADQVLIDDKYSNITEWIQHGGIGILFPRAFNRARDFRCDPVKYVQEQLVRADERIYILGGPPLKE